MYLRGAQEAGADAGALNRCRVENENGPHGNAARAVLFHGGQRQNLTQRTQRSQRREKRVMTQFDFRSFESGNETVVKRSTFAATAIAHSVQGCQLVPGWPAISDGSQTRLPGSKSSKEKSNKVGNSNK